MAKSKTTKKKVEEPKYQTPIIEHSIMVTPEGEEKIIIEIDVFNEIVYAKGHNSTAKWYSEEEVKTWTPKEQL